MDRQHGPEDGVDVFELLAHQAQGQVVEPHPAVALGEANARQSDRRELGENLRVVAAGAVVGLDRGRELAGAEVANCGDELLLVRGEREIQHLRQY